MTSTPGTWNKLHGMCSVHGATNCVSAGGVGTYRYCPLCKIKTLEHELATAKETIGLLQAQVELEEENGNERPSSLPL